MTKQTLACLISLFLLFTSTSVHAEAVLKAAFTRGGDLWLKVSEIERQITDGTPVYSSVWSYDGTWLAYTQKDGIWVYDTVGQKRYQVYHKGGANCRWAPDKNVLAFQDQTILDISDLRSGKPKSFVNVALGVGSYSWMPDGSGFLVSSDANLLPDGWTNPILFKVSLGKDLNAIDLVKNVQRFFTIPRVVKQGTVVVDAIGTSGFKWSTDRKWIAFLVEPTASLSMDSDMLCVLSSDGKTFTTLDKMALGFPFAWALGQNRLGYIKGGGRIVFGFHDKHLKVKEFPVFQSLILTPKKFVDLDFTWQNDNNIVVSRAKETQWSNVPSKRALPALVAVNLQDKKQKQISFPPTGFGDFHPEYLPKNKKMSWIRSDWEKHDVWISEPDGTSPRKWIENVDGQTPKYPK